MKHIFSLLLTLSLCACSAVGPGGGSTDDTTTPDTTTPPAPETTTPPETCPPAVTEIRPDDETYVTWYGRTANGAAGRVYFDYTASGFTVCFRGSKLELTFAATEWNNEKARPYITVITDGEDYLSAPVYALDKSTQTITLELEEGEHTVRVLKRSEAHQSRAALTKAVTDGTFLPAAARPEVLIEFYGDSITCGYGNRSETPTGFSTETEDGLATYAFRTAEALGAEASVISKSGIAVNLNVWENPLKLGHLVKRSSYHTQSEFKPERQADVVVIYGGVNDRSYVSQASSASESKQRLENFTTAYTEMLGDILSLYPSAKIVCCTGMYGEASTMGPRIRKAMTNAATAAGIQEEGQLYYLELPAKAAADGIGADGHPSVKTHERGAEVLTEKLKEILGR